MVDRINLILKAKNLTSRQFAEEIGIQPSGMSHILSGRNRPSLDFVMKVVSRYPEIDIKWLTLGEGEMYSTANPVPKTMNSQQPDLFSSLQDESLSGMSEEKNVFDDVDSPLLEAAELESKEGQQDSFSTFPDESTVPISNPIPIHDPVQSPSALSSSSVQVSTPAPAPTASPAPAPAPGATNNGDPTIKETVTNRSKHIVKVVILYDDHTFAEYFPE